MGFKSISLYKAVNGGGFSLRCSYMRTLCMCSLICSPCFYLVTELEKIAGKARFITIYLLSGIVGNMATFMLNDSSYASLGASGAIFGIFGAFGALVYYTRRTMPMLRKLILPIIVISVIMTFLQSNVNVYAHLGGLVTGFLLGLIYLHPTRILSWRKQRMAGK